MTKTLCLALAVALVAISGCTIQLGLSSECSTVLVINNTKNVNLDILADGEAVCEGLKPGGCFKAKILFDRYTNISIIGRDSRGGILGATSYVFWGGEYREYRYNYANYRGGSGAISQSWVINTQDLRKRE